MSSNDDVTVARRPPSLSLDFAQRVLTSRSGGLLEALAVSVFAIAVSLVIFGLFLLLVGVNPLQVYGSIYKGAFGSWFSWQNTLQRAAPLMLTALCTALPAQLGMIVIGGEGALVIGAVATVLCGLLLAGFPPIVVLVGMCLGSMIAGGLWIAAAGMLRHYRGVNETISTLLMNYIAIAVMYHLTVEVLRDPEVVHRPSSWHIGEENMLGAIPGMDVHWGLVIGIATCVLMFIVMRRTTFGFAGRIVGGNFRAAQLAGLNVGRLAVITCFMAGAAAALAGMAEVVAVHGRISSSIVTGYGYTGILIAFIARQNPLAIIPAAILLGGIRASGGLLQRWHDMPDASILVLQGIMFIVILASEPLYARFRALRLDRG